MERKKILIQKIKFYHNKEIKCHIKKVPTGFVDGYIKSELEDDTYFWFEDLRFIGKPKRMFIEEVFDIGDYGR